MQGRGTTVGQNCLLLGPCFALAVLTLTACQTLTFNPEGRPCRDGECLPGFVCHPERQLCGAPVIAACDGSGLCPADISTGDGCSTPLAFLPCRDGYSGCDAGCRTCETDGTWSACSDPRCVLGTVTSCATCDESCLSYSGVVDAVCDIRAAPFCLITACAAGAIDLDGVATNGCEAGCSPTSPPTEVCDNADNDCDGVRDNENTQGCSQYFRDYDGDGFGVDGDSRCLCAPLFPYSAAVGGDCDDDPTACGVQCVPGGFETCHPGDNDCDPLTVGEDVDGCLSFYLDEDGDGHGSLAAKERCLCAPSGTSSATVAGDCDDDPLLCGAACNPDAPEICDGFDNDCDDKTDDDDDTGDTTLPGCVDGWADADLDGYGAGPAVCLCDISGLADNGDDCFDDPLRPSCGASCYPGAPEVCDGFTNLCGGVAADTGCILSFSTFTVANANLPANDISNVAVGSDGTVWASTSSLGVLARKTIGAATMSTVGGFKAAPINTLDFDSAGGLWVGYQEASCGADACGCCDCGPSHVSSGAGQPVQNECTNYMTTDTNQVTAMWPGSAGSMWIGTTDDIGYYAAGSDELLCDFDVGGGIDGKVQAILGIGSSLWFGTAGFLRRGTPAPVVNPGAGACPVTLTFDDAIDVTGDTVDDDIDALAYEPLTAAPTDDRLWIASSTYGLFIYRFANTPNPDFEAVPFSLPPGGFPTDVLVIPDAAGGGDTSAVVVATTAGLVRYLASGPTTQVFTMSEGLPSNDVRDLAFHAATRTLWIATAAGLVSTVLP